MLQLSRAPSHARYSQDNDQPPLFLPEGQNLVIDVDNGKQFAIGKSDEHSTHPVEKQWGHRVIKRSCVSMMDHFETQSAGWFGNILFKNREGRERGVHEQVCYWLLKCQGQVGQKEL